jgi:hypothetical protein
MFNKIVYDDGATDFEHWKAYDYDSLKETYVKLVVLNNKTLICLTMWLTTCIK